MREHPIPQDITGYQFHIIGNMTIKQFAEVGAGAFIGFLIYTTNLPVLIKWPLIGVSVALGAMAAFVPIEERPFDHWIVTFIRVLYKPTKFYWKKVPKIPDPFLYKQQNLQQSVPELDLTPARRERVKEYLSSLHVADPLDPFDEYEKNRVDDIVSSFAVVKAQTLDVEKQITKPNLEVRVRDLTEYLPAEEETETYEQPYQPEEIAQSEQLVQSIENTPAVPTQPQPAVSRLAPVEEVNPAPQQVAIKPQLSADQVAQDIAIPETENIQIAQPTSQEEQAELAAINQANGTQAYSNTQTTQQPVAGEQAHYNADLPFPTPPDEPNTPVGMVLGPNNELITNAIVEFISETGNIVRAVKTNSLGQFTITTKLNDGTYTLQVEKDGFQFTPQQVHLAGEIVQPIEIRGTPTS